MISILLTYKRQGVVDIWLLYILFDNFLKLSYMGNFLIKYVHVCKDVGVLNNR